MLHLFFHSPIETAILERTDAGDVLVFLENSVLGLLQEGVLAEPLIRKLTVLRLCVLADDLTARGITPDALVKGIEVIDYEELVALTIQHPGVQSWA